MLQTSGAARWLFTESAAIGSRIKESDIHLFIDSRILVFFPILDMTDMRTGRPGLGVDVVVCMNTVHSPAFPRPSAVAFSPLGSGIGTSLHLTSVRWWWWWSVV